MPAHYSKQVSFYLLILFRLCKSISPFFMKEPWMKHSLANEYLWMVISLNPHVVWL